MKYKYTVYGDEKFDDMIDKYMLEIKEAVLEVMPEEYLSALILGGGYGRGEGGVFIENNQMELYNDFDFFVISNNISRAKMSEYYHKLFEVGEKLTEKIGIDVDFGPFRNISELANMKFTMMWYELKQAHIVIYGDKDILNAIPDFKPEEIPFAEAMGLILNRSVGLLFAKQRLDDIEKLTTPDKDFIERNIYKAAMAAGDAFLICNHTFNHSYVERMNLMDKFKNHDIVLQNKFLELYKRAILYKLKPVRKNLSHQELSSLLHEVKNVYKKFFLFVAEKAWQRKFTDFYSFGECVATNKIETDSIIQIMKNIILNFKEVGGTFSFKWFLKYPRYRLFYAVPFFAFQEKSYEKNIPAVLGIPNDASDEEMLNQFIKLWERFN